MGGILTASSAWPAGLPLRAIENLPDASSEEGRFTAELTASAFTAALIPGRSTVVWGYNSSVPGPLIELWEGERAEIAFTNRLTMDSTIHWHGLPVPPDQDGSPMDPVAPGATRTYAFDVPAGSAGTYWYHPHSHRTVTLQAGHGLAGPLIVRSADDPLQGIPELTLMISGVTLDANGQIVVAGTGMGSVGGMGTMGGMGTSGLSALLVNGQKVPVHSPPPGATERWRVINATADRYLRLAIDGRLFAVVGTDGGLLEEALLDQAEWLLAPGQRVELVVTMPAEPATRLALRDIGYGGGMGRGGGAELMTVLTAQSSPLPQIAIPAKLRPIADLGAPTAHQRVVLSGMGMMSGFLINGRSFDMNRVDLETVVGRIELWDIVNASMMDHPIHIHGTQFQVMARTIAGVPTTEPYRAWLDTVNVPAGETVTIKTRQTMPGKRMVHCHILPHEDAGMMAVLEARLA